MALYSIIAEALLQPPLFMFIYMSNIIVKKHIFSANFKYLVTYFNFEKTAIQSNDNKVKCLFGIKF